MGQGSWFGTRYVPVISLCYAGGDHGPCHLLGSQVGQGLKD